MKEETTKSYNSDVYAQGTVYSKDYIDKIKEKLEDIRGIQLCKANNQKDVSINSISLTSVAASLRIFNRKLGQHQQLGFQLTYVNENHSKECTLENEDYNFGKMTKFLDQNRKKISDILTQRQPIHGRQNPKKLLQIVSRQLGLHQNFIYVGIQNVYLKRRIKKKFDNMVAKIRKNFDTSNFESKNKKLKRSKLKKINNQPQAENQNDEIEQNDGVEMRFIQKGNNNVHRRLNLMLQVIDEEQEEEFEEVKVKIEQKRDLNDDLVKNNKELMRESSFQHEQGYLDLQDRASNLQDT